MTRITRINCKKPCENKKRLETRVTGANFDQNRVLVGEGDKGIGVYEHGIKGAGVQCLYALQRGGGDEINDVVEKVPFL